MRQQSAEAEKGNALRQRLMQDKAQLEIQVASIGAELQEAKRRCVGPAAMEEDNVFAMNWRRLDQCDETSQETSRNYSYSRMMFSSFHLLPQKRGPAEGEGAGAR